MTAALDRPMRGPAADQEHALLIAYYAGLADGLADGLQAAGAPPKIAYSLAVSTTERRYDDPAHVHEVSELIAVMLRGEGRDYVVVLRGTPD